jgi:hypothetical protein
MEVANSESFKGLLLKAHDFTVRSQGRVQLVIGFDIRRKTSFKLSAWLPKFYQFEN